MVSGMGDLLTPIHLIVLLIALPVYFLPTLIAGWRKAEHYWWIAIVNLLTGGTGAGWFVALLWASVDQRPLDQAVAKAAISA